MPPEIKGIDALKEYTSYKKYGGCAPLLVYQKMGIPMVLLESKGVVKKVFAKTEVHYKNGAVSRIIHYRSIPDTTNKASKPLIFSDTYYSMGRDLKGLPCIVSYRSRGYSYRLYDANGKVKVERYTDKDGLLHRSGNKPAEIFYRDGKMSTSTRYNHGIAIDI